MPEILRFPSDSPEKANGTGLNAATHRARF